MRIQRREFITMLGGAAIGLPLAAWAQQSERMRRVGVLLPASPDDPDFQTRVSALAQGLEACNGWTYWHVEKKGALLLIDRLRAEVRAGM